MMMQDSFMFLSSYPISQWTEKTQNVHHILLILSPNNKIILHFTLLFCLFLSKMKRQVTIFSKGIRQKFQ